MQDPRLTRWHQIVQTGDLADLDDFLAEDVVFHSPIVHTPQKGKALTKMYLMGAFVALQAGKGVFRYLRETVSDDFAVLEFEADLEGIVINGVDMIAFDEAGHICDFKVMVRPLKAINLIHERMQQLLAADEMR